MAEAEHEPSTDFARKTLQDRVERLTFVLYLLAGMIFIVGLYFDLEQPGVIVIEVLSIANDPSNSGLFILSFILLTGGFILGRIVATYDEWQKEEIDQTQEWEVDVGK